MSIIVLRDFVQLSHKQSYQNVTEYKRRSSLHIYTIEKYFIAQWNLYLYNHTFIFPFIKAKIKKYKYINTYKYLFQFQF